MDPILTKATDLHLAMDDSSVLQAAKDLFLFASTSREDASFSTKPTEHMTKIPSSLELPNKILDAVSAAMATKSSHSENETEVAMVERALKQKKKDLPFPVILMTMLNDESIHHIITFLPHGQSFVILERDQLMSDVLPVYFPGTTSKVFASFARKLNRWGFKLERGGGAYFHPLFQRDSPEKCRDILIRPKASKANNIHGESATTQDLNAVRTNENSSSVRVSPTPSVISVTKCSHEEDPNTNSRNNEDGSKVLCTPESDPGMVTSKDYQKKKGEYLQKHAFIPYHGYYGPPPMMYRDPYYFNHCMYGKNHVSTSHNHRAPKSPSEEKDVDEEKKSDTVVSPMDITSETAEEVKAATSTVNKEDMSDSPAKDNSSNIEVNGDSNDAQPSANADNNSEVVTSNHNVTASTPKREGSEITESNHTEDEVISSSQNVVTPINTSVETKDEGDVEMVSYIIPESFNCTIQIRACKTIFTANVSDLICSSYLLRLRKKNYGFKRNGNDNLFRKSP